MAGRPLAALQVPRRVTSAFVVRGRAWGRARGHSSCCGTDGAPSPPNCGIGPSSGNPNAVQLRSIVGSFERSKPVEEASTLPSAWYTERCVLEAERCTVFAHNWQLACHSSQVKEPGQFRTVTVGQEPLIIVRDEKGRLHGHYNVCRHHAAIVERRDAGSATFFRCSYHGFEYALDGRLRKAMQLKGIKNFSAKSFGLVKAEMCEWGPFIFVRPRQLSLPQVAVTEEPMSFLQPLVDATRGEMAFPKAHRFVHQCLYKLDCNWKVVVDNYLDGGYHVPHLHVQLSRGLSLQSYMTKVFPRCSLQSVGAKNIAELSESQAHGTPDGEDGVLGERMGTEAFYSFIYPNLMLNRYGPWLDINICRPLGVDRCEVLFEYYLDEDVAVEKEQSGTLAGFVADCLEQSDRVQQEDIDVCQSVQCGLQSVSYDTGRYAPGLEHGMHDFHCTLAEDVARALPPS